MCGETDLGLLLARLEPELDPETYVFVQVAGADMAACAAMNPLMLFAESEGVTLVLTRRRARDEGFGRPSGFRRIVLTVRSSLHAVGLTAAVAARLAELGTSANVVAAHDHDHLFVPEARAAAALTGLRELSTVR